MMGFPACRRCGRIVLELVDAIADAPPTTTCPVPGVIVVCSSCGHLQLFVGTEMRDITKGEIADLDRDLRGPSARAAHDLIVETMWG